MNLSVRDAINSVHLVLWRALEQTPEITYKYCLAQVRCRHQSCHLLLLLLPLLAPISDKRLKAGVLAQMSPLPDSSWSPLHSRRLLLSHSRVSVRVLMSQRTLLWCLDRLFYRLARPHLYICHRHRHLDERITTVTTQHPTQSLTVKIDSLDCFFSLCISLHTVGRDGSLAEWDNVEVHLILNCNVIFLTLEKSLLLSYV